MHAIKFLGTARHADAIAVGTAFHFFFIGIVPHLPRFHVGNDRPIAEPIAILTTT